MTYESQLRATFEDTKKSQKQLRHIFDELIKNNIPIDHNNRDKFFDLLADATFGMGTKPVKLYLPEGKVIELPDLEEFIRCLFYYNKSVVDGNFFFQNLGRYQDYNINISEIWMQIRNRIFGVFSQAISMSMRISKEQKKTSGGMGSYVGPKDTTRYTN